MLRINKWSIIEENLNFERNFIRRYKMKRAFFIMLNSLDAEENMFWMWKGGEWKKKR